MVPLVPDPATLTASDLEQIRDDAFSSSRVGHLVSPSGHVTAINITINHTNHETVVSGEVDVGAEVMAFVRHMTDAVVSLGLRWKGG